MFFEISYLIALNKTETKERVDYTIKFMIHGPPVLLKIQVQDVPDYTASHPRRLESDSAPVNHLKS